MAVSFSRGFHGRPRPTAARDRLPPGQYETRDFPVLSAGPTPRVSLQLWDFTLGGRVGGHSHHGGCRTWRGARAVRAGTVRRRLHHSVPHSGARSYRCCGIVSQNELKYRAPWCVR